MLSEAQRENTKLVLIELFGLWDKRSSSYGNVLFCSAMTERLTEIGVTSRPFSSPCTKRKAVPLE